jgi:hypothetical protein
MVSGKRCLIWRYCLLTGDTVVADADVDSAILRPFAGLFNRFSTLKVFSRAEERGQQPVRGSGTRLGYVVEWAKASLADRRTKGACP